MSVQGQSERALGSFACQPATSFEHVGEGVVEVDMDGCIVLPNDTVMPLALIVNELVNNAVKRGIRNGISDKVRVSLTKSDGQLLLSIEDGGEHFDLAAYAVDAPDGSLSSFLHGSSRTVLKSPATRQQRACAFRQAEFDSCKTDHAD